MVAYYNGVQYLSGKKETADEMIKRLERAQDHWLECLKAGQDDNNPDTDAYHCKYNARNIVRKLSS